MTGSCWMQFSNAQWCNELHVCLSYIWWTPSVGTIVSTSGHLQLTYELDLPCLILFYKANAILSFSHCRICVVYFDFEEGNVPISVWAVRLDPYDFVCCLCTILLHCGQHIWRHYLVCFFVFSLIELSSRFGSFCAGFISLHRQELFILYSSLDSTVWDKLLVSLSKLTVLGVQNSYL
jgi:hypothetical protein